MTIRRRMPQLPGEPRRQEPQQQIAQDAFSASVSGAVHAARPAAPVGTPQMLIESRRVLEFEDHADGTSSVLRCVDPTAQDIDVQFEAGARHVVSIAPKAFSGCVNLRRVILPDTLRLIGEMAFTGCSALETIEIPGSVVKVGTLAFAKCASLTRVRLLPGVQALGPSCFSKCARLTRVDVPASVASFGGGVFFGCGKALTLYGGGNAPAQKYAALNQIAYDSERFKDDEQLLFAEEEDGTLTVLGPRQEAPVVIDIPSELCGRRIARIAPKAFFACASLEAVRIGGGVSTIGENAFFGCRALCMLSLERGLERVGESAFAGCASLAQVTLPWGTASVGRMAFFGCSQLAFVKMPTTTRVEDMAFDGCAPTLRVFGGVNAGRVRSDYIDS